MEGLAADGRVAGATSADDVTDDLDVASLASLAPLPPQPTSGAKATARTKTIVACVMESGGGKRRGGGAWRRAGTVCGQNSRPQACGAAELHGAQRRTRHISALMLPIGESLPVQRT